MIPPLTTTLDDRHAYEDGPGSFCRHCQRRWGNPVHRKPKGGYPVARSPYYATTDQPVKRVKFIPVKDGDLVQLGATSIPGAEATSTSYYEQIATRYPHTFIGFKPASGPRAAGWIVVLVDERNLASQPVKRRESRRLKAVG